MHVEIGLPDETGRVQILSIHTAGMRSGGYLDPKATHTHKHTHTSTRARARTRARA